MDYGQLYIDGHWVAPQGQGRIAVENPATEAICGSVPEGNAADADAAARAAAAAFPAWAATPAAERGAWLKKIADGLKARQDELGRLIATEVGMPVKLATRVQAGNPIFTFGACAKIAAEGFAEERIGHSLILREPTGAIGCITPWNFPLHQIAAKVAAALAAGCTVVLKPSEVAPLNAFVLAEVIHEVGLPAGVFNLVTGYGPVVGEALAAHPALDGISFTGSTRAGKRVAAVAAATVKRVSLELGGKSASLVLPDADLAAAVKGTVGACFLNSGQACSALSRLLVPESRYAEAAALAVEAAASFSVGDPFADTSKLGPLVSAAQRQRVLSLIDQARAEGAELLCGGTERPEGLEKGHYVCPTVFGRVKPDATLAQEEVFGPVLAILTYRDGPDGLDAAVAMANATSYGLAAAVWSGDENTALAVARRLRAGQVEVNGAYFNMLAPFGGFKQSGYGRELGRHGVEEFLESKAIQLKG
ncbi:MAG TPA: aldehyde dehydrogenase family protein [Azospira sp.]|nr:aldehyde dehydrogenase family protein [Azospira sp.]